MALHKTFVQYFVPNKKNDYRPFLLRVEIAGFVVLVIIALFVLSTMMQRVLVASNSLPVAAVIASTVVNLTNDDRVQDNLQSLTVSPQLQAAAQAKANDMAANGYFAHVSPAGRDPWYWFTQAGYNFSYGGENLAVYFSDSNAVNSAWMNSVEHRANILNIHFTQIGVATAEGVYQGHETTFVVQDFGTPASAETGTDQSAVAVSSVAPEPVTAVAKATPKVEGASIVRPNVKVITQDKNFIAVENEQTSTPAPTPTPTPTPAAAPNPISVFILKFITSPGSDLVMAYGIIGAIIALALIFEVTSELRRPHPHRIALGLSLMGLMLLLLFVGHVFIFGQLRIT